MSTLAAPPAASRLDVARLREEFPFLAAGSARPLAYLDNTATTQKPRAVLAAVDRHYRESCANVHRGVYRLAERASDAYEGARRTVRRFLGAARDEEIVFVRGTTEAVNLVAQTFAKERLRSRQHGDAVLVTEMEHHSNLVPWQMLCEELGGRLLVVPINDRGALDLEAYERLLGEGVAIAAFAHVSNVLGTVNPITEMTALAHAHGVPVLVDGAQGVPHVPVDVVAVGCDFYCFSGHKVYAPTGIGALYGRHSHLLAMPPYQGGGSMIRDVTFVRTLYAEPPARFEAGTPDIGGAIGLGAALDWVSGLGWEAIAAHEGELLAEATARLAAIPGLHIHGTAPHKASVISFTLEGVHPHDIGTILDADGVAVRAGHHCAKPLMDRLGVPATVRASFAVYNTPAEVDALVSGLARVQEMFG